MVQPLVLFKKVFKKLILQESVEEKKQLGLFEIQFELHSVCLSQDFRLEEIEQFASLFASLCI